MSQMKEALALTIFILSLSIPAANSESFDNISFNFPSFQSNDQRIDFQEKASILNSAIQLSPSEPYMVGRAIYHQPMHLWDSSTGNVADFVSRFTFAINSNENPWHAEGLAFFLAPNGSQISEGPGVSLGIISSDPNPTNRSAAIIAVEFDASALNGWDPLDPPCCHIGIDLYSLYSANKTCVLWMEDSVRHGRRLHALVTYNSREMNLSVVLGDDADNYTSLYYQPVNLTDYLPEWVVFGFSAATGQWFEAHTIFSWEFNSSLRILDNVNGTTNGTTANTLPGGPPRGKKIPAANSKSFDNISFNFPSFQSNDQRIDFQEKASILNSAIQLSPSAPFMVGRAIYHQPMHLWDSSTGNVADFVSRFTFAIDSNENPWHAEGLAFFLAPNGLQISEGPGGSLGILSSNPNPTNRSAKIIAVEFDASALNSWDPLDPPCCHIGIDLSSLYSVNKTCVSWMEDSVRHGQRLCALVTYNSREMNLSVVFEDDADNYTSLYYLVNLKEYLPEWVVFGFSATTGQWFEAHTIFSWEFNSSLRILGKKSNSWVRGAIFGLSSLVFLILVAGLGWYGYKLKRSRNDRSGEEENAPEIDEEFEQSRGPKEYSYKVLAVATNNFANTRLLGKGGFGGVYEGHLADSNSHVAIKKITPESKQGVKEYATEVKTIRHLRHKNLVELVGWCHEKNKFLLVYEFMSNGSLDSHLFKDKTPLTWEKRYGIAQGIALGLKYLHEDLKQCVVHRDIKSSNILLDAQFEAKLGDFGLARIVEHAKGSETTLLAGTMGYLAPECIYTGKANKESDVYSFGVVLLEIACGRRAIEPRASEDQIQLVEWVWELYGTGKLFDAADPKLGENYDARQMECLMIVGLWCAHPDPKERPPISKAIAFLNFDASPPILPPKLPIPSYIVPASSMPESSHVLPTSLGSSEPSSTYSAEMFALSGSSEKSSNSSSALLWNTV